MKNAGHTKANGAWSDYPRLNWVNREHHARYAAYVKAHGLICQECGGRGESGRGSYEPPDPCGFCETTGRVTRWGRGRWLRWKRDERKRVA
jgi:hypothetical protein